MIPGYDSSSGLRRFYVNAWILVLFLCCGCDSGRFSGQRSVADSARFARLIATGDSIYATKNGFGSFAKSLIYFDSAQRIAERAADTLLLAEAAFAKGRVHDAWNKDGQKTIDHFTKATQLFKAVAGKENRYFYAKHLIAHAYDKVRDSARAVAVLHELIGEIGPLSDSGKRDLPFTAEMALIASEVRNYRLADSILRLLNHRSWIANDPATYNYLDHYYLTQARLDAFWRRPAHSFYLDSLVQVYNDAQNNLDRAYYSINLAELYTAYGNMQDANMMLRTNSRINDSLNNSRDAVSMQNALLQSELSAEKRRAEYEEDRRYLLNVATLVLSVLLAIITVLSVYLYRRNRKYRQQSVRMAALNLDLDKQINQVALLNKEIKHRVKNNLHMVYSLLQMQERKSSSDDVVEALQSARLRVESIAALHDQLLSGNSNLNFSDYLRDLISSVVKCLSDEKRVVTHISSMPIRLPVNNYTALSLVLNEWVTNSVKYAAVQDNIIEIRIDIAETGNEACITYADNGVPAAGGAGAGLGTQIVQLLCRQMGARLSPAPDNPYRYQLCIPYGNQP